MKLLRLISCLVTFVAAVTTAQAGSLTTLFNPDITNGIGGALHFDLNVLAGSGITITSIDVSVNTTAASIGVDVWARTGTFSGFESSTTGWSLVSTGSGVPFSVNSPSAINLSDFSLPFGVGGIAIVNKDFQARYTTGTGLNQFFSNSDLSLSAGSAANLAFSGNAAFTPVSGTERSIIR